MLGGNKWNCFKAMQVLGGPIFDERTNSLVKTAVKKEYCESQSVNYQT